MTDAERLRKIARSTSCWAGMGLRDVEFLHRIADLLEAVPPEVLEAIKKGTWKAMPVEPTEKMRDALLSCHTSQARYLALLAAAPEVLEALGAKEMVAVPVGFARFLENVMESAREHGGGHYPDIDGGWLQDRATDVGILVAVPVTEACGEGENCVCVDYGFPTECYRYSPEFKAMRKVLAAAPEKPE